MKRTYPKILRNRKNRIARPLRVRAWAEQPEPMLSATNIHYQMSDKIHGHSYGGIGAIHLMVHKLKLAEEIDARLHLLKRHLPYHESDHVLNLAYNALLGGLRLEDIELRRNDEAFLDGLGAQRIPDPTTSGDFTRRLDEKQITTLMEAVNATRQRVWAQQPPGFLQEAVIEFVLGMDASVKLVGVAHGLADGAWQALERLPKYEIATEPRCKPERVKERVVERKGYVNKKLVGESVAEFEYRPQKCKRSYRMVVVRKNLSVQKGEQVLFDDIRYFFYITNRTDMSAPEVVGFANDRCDQENVIEQLKNGVNAMRMPVNDLVSNWAYMVMTALAWNLKAWYGLLMADRERGLEVVRMEFRRFLHAIVLLPAQIVRMGRRIVYRVLSWNGWLRDFFATWERLRHLAPG